MDETAFPINVNGLDDATVAKNRLQHGFNEMSYREQSGWLTAILNTVKEPMFLLLLAACIIYFVSGAREEGFFMLGAILLVSSISIYQDFRSRNALQALKKMIQPLSKVIRNHKIEAIPVREIVIDDILITEEGSTIAADATIIYSNDFTVNEAMLTGESFTISKNILGDSQIYQGTMVTTGMAIGRVTQIGNFTRLGAIGKSLQSIKEIPSPLQVQIENFVKKMAIGGLIVFAIVWGINFFKSYDILSSLIKALTLAMSILPEEIPVAFTTFMALGAWRLMQQGIIVKQIQTVEALGSATVICTDKTGTITENKMELAALYVHKNHQLLEYGKWEKAEVTELISYAMWASEPLPFDPMEMVLHQEYAAIHSNDERVNYTMVHEYPLAGRPPMMTHVYENKEKNRIIAAKGAPEKILSLCNLPDDTFNQLHNTVTQLASKGYRVLAVAKATDSHLPFPESQESFSFELIGLVSFYDPPKKNIAAVFETFYKAGIRVKIITGDNAATTTNIALQSGFKNDQPAVDGDSIMQLPSASFHTMVEQTNIFTRMFPEAKLKVIEALIANGEIVAMTGDGVNDGPALKAAHIGIAMGKRGSEMAKSAASLILVDDDLSKMADAVAMGRKIYTNLKKAIQYIISIHIPIILMVFLPLLLGWLYPSIFTPVHVITMEIIMGPTCSIIYENEPIEKNLMLQPPLPYSNSFLSWKELQISIWQGLAITTGLIAVYQWAIYLQYNEMHTRTLVFCTLVFANIFLTLTNRSFYYSILYTLKYKNKLIPIILSISIGLMLLILYVKPVARFYKVMQPSPKDLLLCGLIAFISVMWIEIWKWSKRKKSPTPSPSVKKL